MRRTVARDGPRRVVGTGFHARVRDAVAAIPRGRVATYGDIAGCLGARKLARHVGYALAALPPDTEIPWHRVVSSRGRVSRRADGSPCAEQIARLRAEGLEVDDRGTVRGAGCVGAFWLPTPASPSATD